MAKSIKYRTEHSVLGIDISKETMALAAMSGAIDGTLTDDKLAECDIVMIAIAPEALLKWAGEHAAQLRGVTLVDLCGVKRGICAELAKLAEENGFSYIGGHPMAGKEVSGFTHATSDLYHGADMILTPDKDSDILMLDMLKSFFLSLGFAHITFSSPEEHDRIIAYTSQLAHIASSAYIKSPTAQRHMGFSAGSYKDMTRVARLDENLWTELFMANSDFLCEELKELIGHLGEYLAAIESGDREAVRELLKRGRELKQSAGGY